MKILAGKQSDYQNISYPENDLMIFNGIIQYHGYRKYPQKNHPKQKQIQWNSAWSHNSLHGHVSLSAWFKDDLRLFRTYLDRGVECMAVMFGHVLPQVLQQEKYIHPDFRWLSISIEKQKQ